MWYIFFIFYELDIWQQDLIADFTLEHCLCGAVMLIKHADPDIYSCSR